MFSVTRRIENVTQPKLGYIPPKELKAITYFDKYEIKKINPAYKATEGMAVDYLTRFMNGTPKHIAFQVSLMGAEEVDERDNAYKLLNGIKGLDSASIRNACQLVGYDVVYRRGRYSYSPVDKIRPSKQMIQNIDILVNRSLIFLKKVGPVVSDGFTFTGGYNDVISCGDGDYLTKDTLWDFKVSENEPTSRHTLQLLVYYILGIHSIHPEFQKINKLGIYNSELNTAYTISLSSISDEVFYNVSRDVIGYCMPGSIEQWRSATGTSKKAENELKSYFSRLSKDTGFSPDKYGDGIYDITVDDYWSFLRKITTNCRPKFPHTYSVKFIKNSGFFMFVSVTEKGSTSILQGGFLRKLKRPLEYYYQRLPEYANTILSKFSKYWDALYNLSKQIQSITSDENDLQVCYKKYVDACKDSNTFCFSYESWKRDNLFSGRVHGCIVDIDYHNHIYLNPYDGSITPYSGPSMYQKYAYPNVASLIAANRPEMLPALNHAIETSGNGKSMQLLLANSKEARVLSVLDEQEADINNEPITDVSIYKISNRMKQLQTIYDYHYVSVWLDNLLPHYELKGKRELSNSLTIGETKTMSCGMSATVLADNGYNKVTIQFEDGTIVENCYRKQFRAGKIRNPSLRQEPKKPMATKTYVGETAVMHCGLQATVIEDFGYNDITVQFEDGLVKNIAAVTSFAKATLDIKYNQIHV